MTSRRREFPSDFSVAARDVKADFTPTELARPVPWLFLAFAVALAAWGGAVLFLDSKASRQGEDDQRVRNAAQAGGAAAATAPARPAESDDRPAVGDGAVLFGNYCATCHQANGAGVRGAIPPLDGSRYVLADPQVTAAIVLRGVTGPIFVNDHPYNGRMPTFHAILDDEEIGLILTHIRRSWSNRAGPVTAGAVAAARAQYQGALDQPWLGGPELERAFGLETRPAPAGGHDTEPEGQP